MPTQPYDSFAHEKSLKGIRIGVIREYMNKKLFTKADEQNIDIVDHALVDLRKLGATIVDPGPEGALFQSCINRYAPELYNSAFAKQFPKLFPVDDKGRPTTDHTSVLVDMAANPALVPDSVTIRSLGQYRADGEGKYMMNRYLRERGDANIKSNTDLINKANFYNDPTFPDRRKARESADTAMSMDMAQRLQHRFAVQTIVMECMQEQNLDALVYPTTNIPPPKLGAPSEPTVNGRSALAWTLLGQQGFPAITVPAGFTTEVYDRVRDPSAPMPANVSANNDGTPAEPTRLVGPVAAKLPVGIDFAARPFGEPMLLRIASAYEAATHHRIAPAGFGPLKGEP